MYSKAKIFNLALGALLLQRQVINADTDQSNECKVLLTYWDTALRSTLEDLDLDSTSDIMDLELVEENPNSHWLYAYKYPTKCAFFRRIVSHEVMDNVDSFILKRVGMHEGQKVIFTNEAEATAEYISWDVPLNSLTANTGLAIAYKLAMLSAPLVTGKGARALMQDIQAKYLIAKTEAQEQDKRENFNYVADYIQSDFVNTRTS